MPQKTGSELDPSNYFQSLLYHYGQADGDRFSWIQKNYVDLLNSLSGVVTGDIGFEYSGYLISKDSDDVLAQVDYVKPNTPAASAGIKRGDCFTKVNGTQLNRTNWRSLTSDESLSATYTFVTIELVGGVVNITPGKVVTVGKVAKYSENPVYKSKVITSGQKKIGYLAYNFFAADNGNPENRAYDLELNSVFNQFKSEGVNELVLDLRYNNGGSIRSATCLASMIVPNLDPGKTFTIKEYNAYIQDALVREGGRDVLIDKFVNTIDKTPINNIGPLSRVFVLTSTSTASASEMIINGLKPYMSVITVGGTTVGKNVGSISIYEENDPRNKWGMQPIILKIYNAAGKADYGAGFAPDYAVEDGFLFVKYELGDENEVLLKKAIEAINGNVTPASAQRKTSQLPTLGRSIETKAWAGNAIDELKIKLTNNR